jgi:hypothetical protein
MQNTLSQDFHKGRNRNMPCPCKSGKKAKNCDCDISISAKRNVKKYVYEDIEEAVMSDAEQYAEEFRAELERDGISFEHLKKEIKERLQG